LLDRKLSTIWKLRNINNPEGGSAMDPISNCDTPAVQVQKITFRYGDSNIKAIVDVGIGNAMTIHGLRIIHLPGEEPWVAFPKSKSTSGKYYPIITCHDTGLNEAIQKAVLTAWQGGRNGLN
jgi:DNA-binding cell septation regulator SpoVG